MVDKRSFSIFLSILLEVVGSKALPNSRILGGEDAPTGKYPWVASIRVDGIHSCSGSIINNYYIITSARCVSSIDNARVTARVGSLNQFAGGEIAHIQSIVIHPHYGNFLHDIALLKVTAPFTFNDKVNKIALANKNDAVNAQVFFTGWGLQESDSPSYKLKYLSVSILNREDCENQAGYGYNSIICLAHLERTGICKGDEGAGVVDGTKLVAVASFYFGNCGTKFPDMSSNVSYYSTWINGVVEESYIFTYKFNM